MKIVYLSGFAAVVVIIYLFAAFAGSIGDYKDDRHALAGFKRGMVSDAIVVLTGGTGRVEAGASLLSKGRARFLILSGVNKESNLKSIFFKTNTVLDPEKIILETHSKSTYENAKEVKAILMEKGFNDILLVTSNYHTKRAFYIFRKVLPPDVKIKIYSVPSPNFDEDKWWQSATSIGIVVVEFIKFYLNKFQLYLYAASNLNN